MSIFDIIKRGRKFEIKMAKTLGLILIVVGFILLIFPLFFKSATDKLVASLPLISSMNSLWISIIGLILVVIGAFLLKGDSGKEKQEKEEVPIYRGKKIVGYRKEEK